MDYLKNVILVFLKVKHCVKNIVFLVFAIVRPRGLSGSCTIKAKIDSFLSNGKKHSLSSQLSGTLEFLLRGRAKVEPNEVVLWNEKSNTRKYEITAGSGHFDLVVGYDVTVISVAVNRKDIEVGSSVDFICLKGFHFYCCFTDNAFANGKNSRLLHRLVLWKSF